MCGFSGSEGWTSRFISGEGWPRLQLADGRWLGRVRDCRWLTQCCQFRWQHGTAGGATRVGARGVAVLSVVAGLARMLAVICVVLLRVMRMRGVASLARRFSRLRHEHAARRTHNGAHADCQQQYCQKERVPRAHHAGQPIARPSTATRANSTNIKVIAIAHNQKSLEPILRILACEHESPTVKPHAL